MKKTLLLSAAFTMIAVFSSSEVNAQTRYIDEVFTTVNVTSGIVYGNNLTVLSGAPAPEDLLMDVYEPTGDSVNRPLIIVMHTGNFLPAVVNGSPTGTRTDSAVVEMCMRFAKRGYTAAAMSNRQGWNPLSSLQTVRTGTIINAAYRGVQDAHTCVRFFNKDVAVGGNTYSVDNSKIVLGGIGTGGYVSLAYASFDDFAEIYVTKFMNFDSVPAIPYIDTSLSGDFKGELARPLNTPSNLGYSSDINMVFNMGGALGDSSWLEAGDVPTVSFHTVNDPNAPYHVGNVIVPTTGDVVIDLASGSHHVQQMVSAFGNNDAMLNTAPADPFTLRANTLNDGYEGLFPFAMPAPSGTPTACGLETEQGSPWDWWHEGIYGATVNVYQGYGLLPYDSAVGVCLARLSNPDMSAAKAKTYIDTIQGYLNPRMYRVLGLCNVSLTDVATNASTCGGTDGAINLTVAGAAGSSSFMWSNAATTEDLTGVVAGIYSVTVTDAVGCTGMASITIADPGSVMVDSTAGTNVLVNGGSTGTVTVSATGGSAPYTFLWNDTGSQTDSVATGLPAGTYVVSVTDANGCSSSLTVMISEPPVGIKNAIGLAGLIVYPNPSADFITIKTGSATNMDIQVYSLRGQLVLDVTNVPAEYKLARADYNSGSYLVKVIANGKQATRYITFE